MARSLYHTTRRQSRAGFLPGRRRFARRTGLRAMAAMALAAVLVGRPAAAEGPAPAGADGLARVRASGVLRWGGDLQGGEPYVFQDPHDPARIVGFEVEIADALARRLGVHASFVQHGWQLLIPGLG